MKEKVFYSKEVKHYEGLGIRDGASCIVKLTNYELQLCDIKSRPILKISLKDISNVAIISDKELIEKDKSVIGRGVVGSVLFGGAGLILGGLSGLQKKQVVQNIDYLIINYKSNGEDKVVNVYANEGVLDKGFMKGLNYAVDISKQELKCPSCGAHLDVDETEKYFVCRSYMDAPDVDPKMLLKLNKESIANVVVGEWCKVRITGVKGYDYICEYEKGERDV